MLKNILKLDGAQRVSNADQKAIQGGRPIVCTDSNIVCTNVGNAACPVNQGCFIQSPDSNYAICQCIKR
jgi:hypothetical protein